MRNKKGLLIVLSGPSGCGKGTILKELVAEREDLFLSVSATTRSPRPGEEDGVHYRFLTKQVFESLIETDGMLEYACYCDNYYGTPREMVEQQCSAGKNVILEIEVQGAMQIRKKYPDAVLVFVLPPSMEELKSRLIGRQTESAAVVDARLIKACEEMQSAKDYDYIVVNDTIAEAVSRLSAIITAESCSEKRMKEFIHTIIS